MKRTIPAALLSAALVPLALSLTSLAASPATAGTPTCRGLEATHVGTPAQNLTTTSGPDVVLTNGAWAVRTLNGDDIICVTGDNDDGYGYVVPGGGNDVVDATAYAGDELKASLGQRQAAGSSGDDVYHGGDHVDIVYVSAGVKADHKDVHLDGGDDELLVDSHYPGTIRAKLGKGADKYWTERSRIGVHVNGEEGRDHFVTKCLGCGSFQLRLRNGSIIIETLHSGRAAGFDDADLLPMSDFQVWRASIKGTYGANRISVSACHARAVGLSGDDTLRVSGRAAGGCTATEGEIHGETGDDVMIGTDGDDSLRGGLGDDEADGRAGDDLCRAEVTIGCER